MWQSISFRVPSRVSVGLISRRLFSNLQVPKGKVFKKEPAAVTCERGQSYKWCSCGASNKQPFCDGRPMCQPVIFKPRETKEYMFCNCKQTNNQPFCDGTHKSL